MKLPLEILFTNMERDARTIQLVKQFAAQLDTMANVFQCRVAILRKNAVAIELILPTKCMRVHGTSVETAFESAFEQLTEMSEYRAAA